MTSDHQGSHPLDPRNSEAGARSSEYDTSDTATSGPRKRLRLNHSATGEDGDDISSALKSQILRVSGLPLTVDVADIGPKILYIKFRALVDLWTYI